MRPLLDGTARSVRNTATSYWEKSVTIRTPSNRLIYNRDASGSVTNQELYDMRSTPDPVENIAAKHPELIAELLGR